MHCPSFPGALRVGGSRHTAAALAALFLTTLASEAVTIVQAPGGTHVAFEAEAPSALIAGAPETWKTKSEAAASGGGALVADGTNSTGDSPHSFAQYTIRFSTAGTYYLYYRWRADETRTAGDVFTANSSWIANRFGAFNTPGAAAQADYYRSRSNDASAPADNTYAWVREADTAVYTVDAAALASPQTLTIGTREAGMIFDRFVFSTEPALSDAQLEALANSESDVVVQGSGESYLAWEPEVKGLLIPGTPESWRVKSEAGASGGAGILADGTNSTGDSPHSFAQFQLKFATAGTYYLYYRWRADETRTAGDVFTANSSWIANRFGAFNTPGAAAQADYYRSRSNDASAPADNTYAWVRETDTAVYTVDAAQLAAIQVLTVGTREAGMIFDRFVLSTEPALTDAQLEALVNSGTVAPSPEPASAVGSAALNTVTVKFTRPLNPSTVSASSFTLTPAVAVSAVAVDAADPRIVILSTAAQAEGTRYAIAISGVRDTSGTATKPGASIAFTAWKRVAGWATKEIFFGIGGDNLQALLDDAKFQAGKADRIEYVRGFQLNQDPQADNYGARLSAFFSPAQSGAYDFFVNNDNEAELRLSSDATEANLSSLGTFPTSPAVFDEAIVTTSGSLTAAQRYLLVGLLKQGGGDVYLNVAARRNGTSTPVASSLPVLGGDRISTYVNPDLGVVTFDQQPVNVSAPAGGRARFAVKITSLAQPVYYQWQVNGVDIPGAQRASYTTPVLSAADNGRKYRCVVSVAGTDSPSAEATLTVGAADPSPLQPYLGVNFVGGGGGSVGGSLGATEVAGAVPQEHWNNLAGFNFDAAPLVDATGASSPVTLTVTQNTETWYSGTRTTTDADGVLLQGFVTAGAGRDPVTYTLSQVPQGTYALLAYSVGFDFTPDYRQAYQVVGETTYPTLYGKAETGLPYTQSPGFRRMNSTSSDNRPSGNYVQFDQVKPASDGSLVFSVTWDAPAEVTGNGHQPAINALQLVRLVAVTTPPTLNAARTAAGLTLSWSASASGFVLESRADLGGTGAWTPVTPPGTITGAGTVEVPFGSSAAFFRLRKP